MNLTDYHAKYFAFELTKRFPSDSAEKLSSAVASAQVDLNPHQVDAALFAFRSPLSQGALLADEVGLGKTIEAELADLEQFTALATSIRHNAKDTALLKALKVAFTGAAKNGAQEKAIIFAESRRHNRAHPGRKTRRPETSEGARSTAQSKTPFAL